MVEECKKQDGEQLANLVADRVCNRLKEESKDKKEAE